MALPLFFQAVLFKAKVLLPSKSLKKLHRLSKVEKKVQQIIKINYKLHSLFRYNDGVNGSRNMQAAFKSRLRQRLVSAEITRSSLTRRFHIAGRRCSLAISLKIKKTLCRHTAFFVCAARGVTHQQIKLGLQQRRLPA